MVAHTSPQPGWILAGQGDEADDALAADRYLERDLFPTWTADASLVLDELERLDRAPGQPFFGRLGELLSGPAAAFPEVAFRRSTR